MTTDPLLAYADHLLIGTGLTGAQAEATASGTVLDTPPHATAATAALRDGWTTAAQTTRAGS
jgi:hypothetical protein